MQVSVQFGAFHEARRYFERMNAQKGSKDPHLSYSQYYLSGAFAGIVNSVISGPIEHVRIRLQTQPHGEGRLYNGPLDCIKKLSSQGGLFNGLYRGEAVTILREAQAYGTWFLSFEYMMDWEARRTNTKREDIPAYKIAGYGGLAGEMLWLSSYPFDVVKSKMQSDGFGEQQRYKNMRDCFRQTLAQEGMGGFVKGIAPTLLRAAPVSAGTFAAYVSFLPSDFYANDLEANSHFIVSNSPREPWDNEYVLLFYPFSLLSWVGRILFTFSTSVQLQLLAVIPYIPF